MSLLGRGNRRKRPESKPRLPALPWVAISGILGVLVVVGGIYTSARWLLNRPVERVVINGEFERVSADQLEAVLRTSVGEGFLAADLKEIQQRIASQPWVASAQVSRLWPDTLAVTVSEEQPAARWGQSGLLNANGRLFIREATHIPAELPRLSGPEGSEVEVASRYLVIREELLERGLGLAALELDSRGAWTMRLSNGISVRLGSTDVDARLTRFYEALDVVVTNVAADLEFVDMRYTNGFSLGWKRPRPMRSADGEPLAEKLPRA